MRLSLLVLAAMPFAAQPAAAALIHDYQFSHAGSVIDSVGGANGTLVGGATVSGGALHLNGTDGFVDFSSQLVPTGSNPYSVFVRVNGTPNSSTFTEIISQGFSGGPGFYLGTRPGGEIRLTDNFVSTGLNYPVGRTVDLLLTSDQNGTNFYIDGVSQFSSATPSRTAATGGSNTRFGKQFAPYAEYFQGDVSAVRIFDTAIAPTAVPEPASWAIMLLGFGVAGATLRSARRSSVAA